ncbi:PREDICTED: uncharacterized protein LOC105555942, partial [Vollenhovia emeryi]|uniref:uncharacterized protein LOC105555942 n=1 Tax=Vollenhovia emeryi TaxID=411798 RepID=UPI0005F4A2AC
MEVINKEARQEEIKDLFRSTTKKNEEDRYEILLPWKENHPPLPDNKNIAEKRLRAVTAKLKKEDLFADYNTVFNTWLLEGVIERVPVENIAVKGHYLPHRPVIKKGSTTRIRPVFDASARVKDSPSLNQCLETGPNLIELVPAILHRFREKKIRVVADIAKAFLQISVSPTDRDVLRFLWWNAEEEIEVYRHRVVFGVTSSPFLLGATIAFHIERVLKSTNSPQKRLIYEQMSEAFYVDDCITSVDSREDLEMFQEEAISLIKDAKFEKPSIAH